MDNVIRFKVAAVKVGDFTPRGEYVARATYKCSVFLEDGDIGSITTMLPVRVGDIISIGVAVSDGLLKAKVVDVQPSNAAAPVEDLPFGVQQQNLIPPVQTIGESLGMPVSRGI